MSSEHARLSHLLFENRILFNGKVLMNMYVTIFALKKTDVTEKCKVMQ
jgi:hypothetical protein